MPGSGLVERRIPLGSRLRRWDRPQFNSVGVWDTAYWNDDANDCGMRFRDRLIRRQGLSISLSLLRFNEQQNVCRPYAAPHSCAARAVSAM